MKTTLGAIYDLHKVIFTPNTGLNERKLGGDLSLYISKLILDIEKYGDDIVELYKTITNATIKEKNEQGKLVATKIDESKTEEIKKLSNKKIELSIEPINIRDSIFDSFSPKDMYPFLKAGLIKE